MQRRKVLKTAVYSLIAVFVLLFSAFFVWSRFTYEPSNKLKKMINLDQVESKNGVYTFQADGANTGIILYPGAKVEPLAYAYIGEKLKQNGYSVFIPRMPFSLAIFNPDQAERIIKENSSIDHWYLGGHSLGGTAAAMYAKKHPDKIDGLYFLASYPSDSQSIKNAPYRVLSISGERDGLSTQEKTAASRKNLPDTTVFEEIKGGNHAQFGMYGEQKGDRPAKIPAVKQQDEIVNAMLDWIKS
ncbi:MULTISPECIES: alpha/beta fold hydrolase [Bacillus]|uniref:alpha/beta fold hydrolase n=1 Tax=Bacillus TaxID=1386 RepID=UPI002244CE29|nr:MULTISPECIES: alpha/beta fold hydrolase [Bacillus]MDN5389004.1 alpha/beta fold hydrolase [Bacillus sp. LB7]MEC1023111.1 alpha/beta fold hydrolase [Bacillus paralicheniformis]MEC1025686.1 alpha/beta fold hydrolase [Bacillus paralicheniformis]MEC1035534.1 alpha/beta fold hydrolase [Bacillus paralicheniformis]MEC1051600.1 alpha/beta fold hydrolase [Bacillus paralicheniformis]